MTDQSNASPPEVRRAGRFLLLNAAPSWLTSMLAHLALLLILALLTVKPADVQLLTELFVSPTSAEVPEIIDDIPEDNFRKSDIDIGPIEPVALTPMLPTEEPDDAMLSPLDDMDLATDIDIDPLGEIGAIFAELSCVLPGNGYKGSHGDLPRQRQKSLEKGPDDPVSSAISKSLVWLVAHQLPDGSWCFDHTAGTCQGRCQNAGGLKDARIGATAMALLPFLGAGQTHQHGKYKKQVEAGLAYLVRQQIRGSKKNGLSEPGGNMYSHGMAAIVLCEAYAMTQDKELLTPAQASINYIVYAQDPVGGGWRYQAKQKGDTSVLGWQLMALKSGHMGYLNVPVKTVHGATKFLDFVQSESGARYGYTSPGSGQATTAIGLLCRMYLGWKRDNPALKRGIDYLDEVGPSKTNMYYNYYATQVMHQYGGESFQRWDARMRDWLVKEQKTEGHEAGSWYIAGHFAAKGGRLYSTSMATMILEVYFRQLPIYTRSASEEEFPLGG